MGKLSAEERPVMGQLANDVRQSLEGFIAQKQAQLKSALMEQKLKKETLDVTMPGKQQAMGVRHPLNIVLDELKEIFRGMGYTTTVYPIPLNISLSSSRTIFSG